jgi:hypothetical protein
VLRGFVRAEPASLIALGRHWLYRSDHFAALGKTMAPGRRPTFVDAVADGVTNWDTASSVLCLLPRERRWAEVRRAVGSAS